MSLTQSSTATFPSTTVRATFAPSALTSSSPSPTSPRLRNRPVSVEYGDQRASEKPLGFWKSDRVPCLPPMVTDITVQKSAVSSLLQKRKGVSLSLLPMSLSLHVGPASEYARTTATTTQTAVTRNTHAGINTTPTRKPNHHYSPAATLSPTQPPTPALTCPSVRGSVTALSERSQTRDDQELESLVSAPMLTTPANIRIMCDLGVHPAAVSVDELIECDNGQDESAREEDVFCLRSLLAATPSLGSLREAREEDVMAAADEREDHSCGARKRCRTGRSSCFSFETGDIHTDLGLSRKHALSMSFAKPYAAQARPPSFRYDHGHSHDLDRDDMEGLPETEVDVDGEADCSSVSSCDTDGASHSPSESPLSQFGALEGTPSLSYSSSESSLATTSSEYSAATDPSEISLSNLSLTSKHNRRESVACTRAQWGTSMRPHALGSRGADDGEEDEAEDGGVDAMFEYDRDGLAPQNEITNHLARFLRMA